MARHKVLMKLPPMPIKKADATFVVESDGKKFGTLEISMGAIVWYRRNSPKGRKISWKKFDEFMRDIKNRFESR
jgi:hypothetical protein